PSELHDYIETYMNKARQKEGGFAYGLPGLIISDRIVAPGWVRQADDLPPHLHYPSLGRVPREEVVRMMNGPEVTTRHYRCLRCEWNGGELSATVYLHIGMDVRTLYI